jgi:hypothetical protein
MRIRKAFLSCTTLAALVVSLAAATVMADDPDDESSTCINPSTPIAEVVDGPCPVSSTGSPACTGTGGWTGIKYKINKSGLTDVATLVTANNSVPGGTSIQPACKGDSKTRLGKNSCHEKAVKPVVFTVGSDRFFWVLVNGTKDPIDTTVAGKSGSKVYCSKLPGLGLDTPAVAAPVTETLTHDACSVEFTLSSVTGAVVSAKLTQESLDIGCSSPSLGDGGAINAKAVEDLEITLEGTSLGTGAFGNGYFQSGTNSCTTRIIGGRVYTWGKPCP